MGAIGALVMAVARGRLNFRPAQAGAQYDGETVLLRGVHPDWFHHLRSGVPGSMVRSGLSIC